jgi:hypothetical protein
MSIECPECERDLRGGHDPGCSRASKRPKWLDGWLDYPHGSLSEKQAREVCWYVVRLEELIIQLHRATGWKPE